MASQAVEQRHAGWVLCRFAGLCLAVRQSEVRAIEPALNLTPAHAEQAQAAWFRRGDALWPVYRLDDDFAASPTNPAERFAVFLETLHRPTGILAEQVTMLAAEHDLKTQAIPEIMAAGGSPIDGLAILDDDEIALVVQAQALGCFLQDLHTPGELA